MLKTGLGCLSFCLTSRKVVKIENQPWKEYQDRLYSVIKGLIEDGVKSGEFPNINPNHMFRALGGLFMGLVFMGDREEPVTDRDVEKLLNQLITDPTLSN